MARLTLLACAMLAAAGRVAAQSPCAVDLAFVLDGSGSIDDDDPNGWQVVKVRLYT